MLTRRTFVDVPRVTPRHVIACSVSSPKTASGGLRLVPPRRAWRTGSQAADASEKNWSGRPWSRRGAVLLQKPKLNSVLQFGKDVLCSDVTGRIADGVAGVATGSLTSAGIKAANSAYAASVGGEIGSIIGRRVLLIAAGPEALIAVGVAVGTSLAVEYARGQVCPVQK